MSAFAPETKHLEALREVRQRERVYPRLVATGSMSQAHADRRIAIMKAIAEDYRPKTLFPEKSEW